MTPVQCISPQYVHKAYVKINNIYSIIYLYLVADWQSYLFHDSYVFWYVMLNGDADATRHQCQHQSLDDAEVWDGVFQITEALGENVEQQRHHTQRCEAGASGQYDAVNVSDKKCIHIVH